MVLVLYGHNYGIVSEGFWLLILGEVAAEMSKSSFPFSGVLPSGPHCPHPKFQPCNQLVDLSSSLFYHGKFVLW